MGSLQNKSVFIQYVLHTLYKNNFFFRYLTLSKHLKRLKHLIENSRVKQIFLIIIINIF